LSKSYSSEKHARAEAVSFGDQHDMAVVPRPQDFNQHEPMTAMRVESLEAENRPMPCDGGVRLHEDERRPPLGPDA
jgi:hypothetical protein